MLYESLYRRTSHPLATGVRVNWTKLLELLKTIVVAGGTEG